MARYTLTDAIALFKLACDAQDAGKDLVLIRAGSAPRKVTLG